MQYYVFIMLDFTCVFIIMSISVKRHELWCTVRDMRLSNCSIIIICMFFWFVANQRSIHYLLCGFDETFFIVYLANNVYLSKMLSCHFPSYICINGNVICHHVFISRIFYHIYCVRERCFSLFRILLITMLSEDSRLPVDH